MIVYFACNVERYNCFKESQLVSTQGNITHRLADLQVRKPANCRLTTCRLATNSEADTLR